MSAQIVFLCAGKGLRMGPLTHELPKSLLTLSNGSSILETNLRNLERSSLNACVKVVGGHCWEQIRQFCLYRDGGLRPRPIFNPDYASAGPVSSIVVALADASDDADIVIANGDTIFSAAVYSSLLSSGDGIYLVTSKDDAIAPDDMGVKFDIEGNVVEAAKSVSLQRRGSVSAGMLLVRGTRPLIAFGEAVRTLSEQEVHESKTHPWHDLIPLLTAKGAAVQRVEVARHDWREFDYQECLENFEAIDGRWQP